MSTTLQSKVRRAYRAARESLTIGFAIGHAGRAAGISPQHAGELLGFEPEQVRAFLLRVLASEARIACVQAQVECCHQRRPMSLRATKAPVRYL